MSVDSKKIQVTPENKFVHVNIDSVQIVERPECGDEHSKLFYNPRDINSADPVAMQELLDSIRCDGLQNPLVTRLQSDSDVYELISGERRLRTLKRIVAENLRCFDEDKPQPTKYKAGEIVICRSQFAKVLSHNDTDVTVQLFDENQLDLTDEKRTWKAADVWPTVNGADFYATIPCRVIHDCSDERALRLAFTDNDKRKGFNTKEEIILCERLAKRGFSQQEIAEMLGANLSWVSHTLSFRRVLPVEAFDRLNDGRMNRNGAVKLMSYNPEDRERLFAATIEFEAQNTKQKLEEIQEEIISYEDEADLADFDRKDAEEDGDDAAAKKAAKKAESLNKKAAKMKEKQEKIEENSGNIRQSHIDQAAAQAGVKPKKSKMLSKEDVEELYITGLEESIGEFDPVSKRRITESVIKIIQETAQAIVLGERDPLVIFRKVSGEMVEAGEFEDDDDLDDDEEFEDDGFGDDDPELASAFGDSYDED